MDTYGIPVRASVYVCECMCMVQTDLSQHGSDRQAW